MKVSRKKLLNVLLSLILWVAIILYISWAGRLGKEKRTEAFTNRLHVIVHDTTEINIIAPQDIIEWIELSEIDVLGLQIDSLDLSRLCEVVETHDFVREANTSVSLNGTVTISVRQRRPVLRIITGTGYDFYYTSDDFIVPAGYSSPHYVPVVTGNFGLPFDNSFTGRLNGYIEETEKKYDENYLFLCKLINFVSYVEDSNFWSSQIVQINVSNTPKTVSGAHLEPEIELIPRVGDHVVMLGWLDGFETKLERLMTFYNKAMPKEGWDKWNYIDLRYDNQVVCSNK